MLKTIKIHKNIVKWTNLLINERISSSIKINLNKDSDRWIISSKKNKVKIKILINYEFFRIGYKSDFPCKDLLLKNNLFHTKFLTLPAPGVEKKFKLLDVLDSSYQVNFDILGFSLWMMNRSEELLVKSNLKDKHGRFKVEFSHAFRFGYLSRPIVDEWLIYLTDLIRYVFPDIEIKTSKFKITPTHDVDNPRMFSLLSKKRILKNYIFYFFREIYSIIFNGNKYIKFNHKKSDPYDTFKWIFELSEKYNLKNEFYFMSGSSNWRFDTGYKIKSIEIINLLKEIHKRGHVIGLHPSYEASQIKKKFNKESNFLKEILKCNGINQDDIGGRMHYLRFQNPYTAIICDFSGFSYDSSLGYASLPGFRCGTCKEFTLFDLISNKILKLRERPLILMEVSLISNDYLGLCGLDEFKKYVKSIKRKCFEVDGEFLFLWHNCQLNTLNKKKMYEFLLKPIP